MPMRSSSAPQLNSLPRLNSTTENPTSSERIVKAEEYMYVQVRRGHWPDLSPDCKLWTLRDFALHHSNWESFTDRGKMRVIYELGSLLNESKDNFTGGSLTKARNELQNTVKDVRQLPRVVRADRPRALAIAAICENSLNLPSAARRLKEALGDARREEFDTGNMQSLGKKFRFKGYIERVEDRAITAGQLRRVIKFCQDNCHQWRDKSLPDEGKADSSPPLTGRLLSMDVLNLYHIDTWMIWPATEESRCSFVELMAEQAQPTSWCISHSWSQPQVAFVTCVEHHQTTRGLHRNTAYWIWAYAHRHHGKTPESADPYQSSFCKALEVAECRLLLVSQDAKSGSETRPFQRLWCMFEVLQSLRRSSSCEMSRAPIDIAVYSMDKAELITYGLTEQEEAMERYSPGTGSTAKSEREKGFPVNLVECSLNNRVELAQSSLDEDRNHILNSLIGCNAKDIENSPPEQHELFDMANKRLNGLFALMFLRKVCEDYDEAQAESIDLQSLKDAVAESLSNDIERTEMDVSLGGGGGLSVNEELFLLVRSLPSKLQKITLDMKGSGLKNTSLSELANFMSAELEDITIDLQGCRSINDNGLKKFMDNFVENCSDRSKLKAVSCLLLGTKVEEGCQEACELLDLEQIQQIREDLELQERKNYVKRLMKNISQSKAVIPSLRKLLEGDTVVTVRGTLNEMGHIDISHVEWNIHSMNLEIMLDQNLLRVLLDFGVGLQFKKRSDSPAYSVLWPVPSRDPEKRRFEVSHRHKAFSADKFADAFKKVEASKHKAIAGTILEVRGEDLIEATVPISANDLKLALIYASREGSKESVGPMLSIGKCSKLLGEVDDAEWGEEDLQTCGLKAAVDAPSGTALMGASENNHPEVVQKLIDWGANIHQQHHQTKATALTLAARKGCLEAANVLLAGGAEEEVRDMQGRVPLSWAAGNGHVEVVEVLLERSAHIDLQDFKGMTAMMHAAAAGQVAVVKTLIENNANIRVTDREGRTAAVHATEYDTDKLGMQQKKRKIGEALAQREKELEAEEAAQEAES
eukprot:TRINITY_DN40568_c0_g1_i1.p1 TRINITY_DN40568_c0_g1~~TRINITY_DN40568_c0_g1_i1.p1  ORF type:complete len:1056 (+),score=212.77 TRINITY_DN40568_c0_g1_i1:46-3168(+)